MASVLMQSDAVYDIIRIFRDIYILTPNDLFLTFDDKLMIDFFAWLINARKKKVVPTKSEHVLRFSPVKFNDL